MRTLEQLNIGPGVVNLSGLEFATNLKSLTIVAPKVSSLEPLRGMQKLEWLRLGDTAVADFSPLSELIALESLYWSDPDVSDLGPLANLRNITFIELSNTGVSDIEPLRNSTRLRTLYLTDSPVSDVGPLSGLTQLTRLYLTGTSVSDLNPLRGLIDLRGIALTGSQVTDLEPLSELIELTWLGLGDTPVSDLGPLSRLVNLEQITLDNAQLTSLAPLADMRKLRRLSAKNAPQKHPPWDRGVECRWRPELPIAPRFRNAISDVAALEGLTGLEWIDLSNNRISTLPPLAALAELRSLWLSGNRIASIAGLEGLSRLDVLDLTDNAVSNLEPLTGILGLYSLYLNGNDISDLAPLAGMKRLSALYLNDNKISTLEPLAHLSLWRLDLGNNRVSDLAELGQLPRQLYLEDNDITDLSPLLPYLPDSRDWDPLRIDVRRNPLDERSGEIARQDSSIFTEDDHGDSPGDATVLDLGTTVEGRLDVEHDVDYFRMRVTEPTAVEIFALQKDLLVYHGRDTLVARGDWISETLPPGTYYVSLSSDCYWNGFDGPESADVKHRGPYVLRTTVPTTVDIPDSNLRAALRDAIASRVGQEVDPITASAMSTLRYVEAARAEIADLTGIEHAGNAADLDISENVISDLQPLVGMSRLLGLDASDNAIADFSPLAGLKDLRRLDLSRNASSDLHPLAHLEDLTRLLPLGERGFRPLPPRRPHAVVDPGSLRQRGVRPFPPGGVHPLEVAEPAEQRDIGHRAVARSRVAAGRLDRPSRQPFEPGRGQPARPDARGHGGDRAVPERRSRQRLGRSHSAAAWYGRIRERRLGRGQRFP